MTISDYREFVSEIEELRARNDALDKALKKEQDNTKALIASIRKIESTSDIAHINANNTIKSLEIQLKKLRIRQYYPGFIGGVRITNDWNAEGVIGIGWKLNLF